MGSDNKQTLSIFTKTIKKITYLALNIGLLFSLIPRYSSKGADFIITSVIREFPMKQGDVLYKDYYINAGLNNGLRKGVYVDAKRKISIYDNVNAKLIGDTPIKVARLKIIHVDKNFSIARLVKFYDKDDNPLSGFDSVMVGDLIEVSEKQ